MAWYNSLRWRKTLLCLVYAVIPCIFFNAYPGFSYDVLIGTEKIGSFSHFAGKRLCHTLNIHGDGVTCRTIPTQDYAVSLTNLQNGAIDLALVNSKMIHDAFNKLGLFKYMDIQYDDMRLLLPFYREPISFLVRRDADIQSLEDLNGKRINGGAPQSIQSMVFEEIMKSKGWGEETFSLFQNLSPVNGQDFIAFNNGNVQAMIHVGMHPDKKLQKELGYSSSIIVGVSDPAITELAESKSGFASGIIGAGTYPGVSSDLQTLAMETLLITSADTDSETVAMILSTLFDARKNLQLAHPAFLKQKVDIEVLNDSYLHPHPAATLFFQENLHRLY